MLTASAAVTSYDVSIGLGRHVTEVPPSNYNLLNIVGLSTLVLDGTAQTWSKTSFAILILRFSEGKMRLFVWFLIISLNLFVGFGCLFFWARCSPVQKAWTMEMTEGTCVDYDIVVHYGMFSSGRFHFCSTPLLVRF
jgi:hypothetical protein